MAVSFDGGVILGADSRTSTGALWWPLPAICTLLVSAVAFAGVWARCWAACVGVTLLSRVCARRRNIRRQQVRTATLHAHAPLVMSELLRRRMCWRRRCTRRASDKITELAENVYCCRSGSAADTQAVTDIVRRHITEHKCDCVVFVVVSRARVCALLLLLPCSDVVAAVAPAACCVRP
jgi:hypothetical protein